MPLFSEPARHPVGAVLGAAEDQHLIVFGALQQLRQQFLFLVDVDGIKRVGDGFGGRTALADLNRFGIFHRPAHQRIDLRRDRRREQHSLPGLGHAVDDLAHVGHEAHIEHAVGLVQHQKFDIVQAQHLALQLIEQPARRCDHDIGTPAQRLILLAVSGAAVQHHRTQVGKARKIMKRGFNLRRQLAGRLEYQGAGFAMLAETRNDRQGERGGLPRAGLRRTDDIPSFERQRNRAQLNRCWVGVTSRLNPFENLVGQTELRK